MHNNNYKKRESKKLQKYALLDNSHHFVPIAIKTSGVLEYEALLLLRELGRWIKAETGKPRSLQLLLQGIAVAVQWGNTAAVLDTASPTDNVYI